MASYDTRWGGVALPPSPQYDGGPRILYPDTPERDAAGDWWFEAGMTRTAIPYSFMISPSGEFGIQGDRWVPLHTSVEGWVESVALAHHAAAWAKTITKVTGAKAAALDLGDYEPVTEIVGVADVWWRGRDSLVAIYTGEAECFSVPEFQTAVIYASLDDWGLHG